jgi:hypothetical protein
MSDRSAMERGTVNKGTQQSDFIRLFTTLGGYMLKKMNRGYLTSRKAALGIRDADSAAERLLIAGNAAADLALLYVAEAVMMGLLYSVAFGTEDDDGEDWAEFLAKEVGMAVVGGVPVIRDVASAFQGYGGGGVYGSVAEIPANVFRQTVQGETDVAFWRSWADVMGAATGLPSTATMRGIEQVVSEDDVPLAELFFGKDRLGD